ncbi:hypothetical protein PT974_12175 [Cladobotryum mycophilum]|uniref:Chromo domain-containing protein n=1 Tax=Cladobotryum mycophilum TaxID=491253 RepID=A0ABR0S7U2_9HYPO
MASPYNLPLPLPGVQRLHGGWEKRTPSSGIGDMVSEPHPPSSVAQRSESMPTESAVPSDFYPSNKPINKPGFPEPVMHFGKPIPMIQELDTQPDRALLETASAAMHMARRTPTTLEMARKIFVYDNRRKASLPEQSPNFSGSQPLCQQPTNNARDQPPISNLDTQSKLLSGPVAIDEQLQKPPGKDASSCQDDGEDHRLASTPPTKRRRQEEHQQLAQRKSPRLRGASKNPLCHTYGSVQKEKLVKISSQDTWDYKKLKGIRKVKGETQFEVEWKTTWVKLTDLCGPQAREEAKALVIKGFGAKRWAEEGCESDADEQ